MIPDRNDSLSRRAVKSGFWIIILRIFEQLFSLARTVVLARILLPSDFGLLGIALLSISLLETFSQTGFDRALIQKKEDIENYLNSAWTIMILRGFLLFIVLFGTAPFLAEFFNTTQAKPIIQAMSFSFLFRGFTNIGVVYFQKELEFNKQFFYRASGTIADFIIAVSFALIFRNVWALVFGILAGNLVQFAASYFLQPHRPRLQLDSTKTKELYNFGKWIFGSSVIIFFLTRGNDFFIGKFLGVSMLGFFQMASHIARIPTTQITHVISQVTFPTYSKLQDEKTKLRETYLKVLKLTAFLSFPLAGLIFAFAPETASIILGEKWSPMIPALQIMAVGGLIRSLGATIGPVFQAIGRPEILTKFMLFQLSLFLTLVYPFIHKWGIAGAALAAVVPGFLINFILSYKIVKAVDCSLRQFYKTLFPPFSATTVLLLFIMVAKSYFSPLSLFSFLLLGFLGILIFLLISFLLNKDIIGILKSLWRNLR
ncbi:MAG: lipopolysaccharide biosynthesis protein [Candidatus Aminicenantes bacterium]